jgi:hypothetical protein
MIHVRPRSSELRSDTPHFDPTGYDDQPFGYHRVVGLDRSVSHVYPGHCVCAASTEEHRAGLKCRTNKVGAYDTDTLQGLDKAPVTVVENIPGYRNVA